MLFFNSFFTSFIIIIIINKIILLLITFKFFYTIFIFFNIFFLFFYIIFIFFHQFSTFLYYFQSFVKFFFREELVEKKRKILNYSSILALVRIILEPALRRLVAESVEATRSSRDRLLSNPLQLLEAET